MSAIPEDYTTITPTLLCNDAAKAIELYTQAFGAKEMYRMPCPESGKIMHACLQIGSSKIFISDANPEMGCHPSVSSFYLYLEDVDAGFRKAKQAGLQEKSPVQDMFWGDRVGTVQDAFGNMWTLATHVREVSSHEMEEGAKRFVESMKTSKAA